MTPNATFFVLPVIFKLVISKCYSCSLISIYTKLYKIKIFLFTIIDIDFPKLFENEKYPVFVFLTFDVSIHKTRFA